MLKNKNTKDYIIKDHLTDDEFMEMIQVAVYSVLNTYETDDNGNQGDLIPYYVIQESVINNLTIKYYTNIDKDTINDIIDTFYIMQNILSEIDMTQYTLLIDRINDGINYALQKEVFSTTNMFGDNTESLNEVKQMIDEIGGIDKLQPILDFASQQNLIKKAKQK